MRVSKLRASRSNDYSAGAAVSVERRLHPLSPTLQIHCDIEECSLMVVNGL